MEPKNPTESISRLEGKLNLVEGNIANINNWLQNLDVMIKQSLQISTSQSASILDLKSILENKIATPPPTESNSLSTSEASSEGPAVFGFWWEKEESNLDWYDWMFQYRLRIHQQFISWFSKQETSGQTFKSIMEVGCGRGVFYPQYFSDRKYLGLEFSKRNTAWLKEKRAWEGHDYLNGDIADIPINKKYDLVFSSGTIDNVEDMDQFVRGMVKAAKKAIYLTAYRGWFEELDAHTVTWQEDTGAFYNDISPSQIKNLLKDLGCKNIVVEPINTGRTEITQETVIYATI